MLASPHWNSNGLHPNTSRMVAPALDLSLHRLPAVCRPILILLANLEEKSVPLLHAADHDQRMARRAHLRPLIWMEMGRRRLPWLQAACHQMPTHVPVPPGYLRVIRIRILMFLGVSKDIDGQRAGRRRHSQQVLILSPPTLPCGNFLPGSSIGLTSEEDAEHMSNAGLNARPLDPVSYPWTAYTRRAYAGTFLQRVFTMHNIHKHKWCRQPRA